jgi:peptide/nickel transport system ATP-binding protein
LKTCVFIIRPCTGDVRALDGVTFSVDDGEIMGLAGESGCGKSTLGNSLIRITSRIAGRGPGACWMASCPSGTIGSDERFPLQEISIIPQYAMNAMNPTRKIGKMIAKTCWKRAA